MKRWWLFGSVRLWLLMGLSGCLGLVAIQPGWAEEKLGSGETKPAIAAQILRLSEIEPPVISDQMFVSQQEQTALQ